MKIIGHRGARGLAPENTIASFQKALEHGVDEIELDVRVSRDGRVVVNHDSFITDPAGGRLQISEHSLEELRQHKSDLAILEDALKTIDRQAPTIIEIKPHEPVEPVVKIINRFLRRGWNEKDFCLASRSWPILRKLRKKFPNIDIMVIEFWFGTRATHRARKLGTKRIGMLEYGLWFGFIHAMKRGDYELYSAPAGTPTKERLFARIGRAGQTNNPAKARHWAKWGLAGVITDYPDRFERQNS